MVSLEFFICHNPSGRTGSLGLNQPLTEMSTWNIYLGIKTAVAYGWHTTFICWLSWNLGASTSNSQGLSRPVQGLIYLYLYVYVSATCFVHRVFMWSVLLVTE
jgi:hypothetical protein